MLITNCTIITWKTADAILRGQAVRIHNDRITDICAEKELVERFPDEEILDAGGQILMPGLICAHTHFYGAFSRGMSIHGDAPADFPAILKQLWWPLDQSLTREDVYYSALVSLVDTIKHGTTTVFDHHASPSFITGSLDTIEQTLRETGIRGSVCYEVTDRGGVEKAEEGIAENVRMIKKLKENPGDSLVTATFGLHASLTLSEKTLQLASRAVPSGIGFHVHTAEHQADEYDSLKKTGLRVVDRLHQHGMTGKNSIFVHGVHLDPKECAVLAETGTWLTHQPRSNMNNAVGMGDVEGYLRMGIPVCMGNDGFSFAMWDEWRACYLAHKLWKRDPRAMPGDKVIQMGANNNAKMASHFFNTEIGVIAPGAKADLILVDYKPITLLDSGNLPWQILFGFRDSMVTMTMVDGKLLMKDRKLLSLDESKISAEAQRLSVEVWKRYNTQF